MPTVPHQFVDRATGCVRTELLTSDAVIRQLYSPALENAPLLHRIASSRWLSGALGYLNYDNLLASRATGTLKFLEAWNVDLEEAIEPLSELDTVRKIFERQIRYWDCRPMPQEEDALVCAADARLLIGTLRAEGENALPRQLRIKHKFFDLEELLGMEWAPRFQQADFALFRLTPEKYHWTHMPVSGEVKAIYALEGRYHSCNPSAIVQLITPYSKNRRVVTLIDTDVEGGSQCGLVAMVEVVALMVGRIEQRYSEQRYLFPQELAPGMFVERGQPKALFRPGSSTVVLLFEPGRVRFADDLIRHAQHPRAISRFSEGYGQRMVEVDVAVRSLLATAIDKTPATKAHSSGNKKSFALEAALSL
ncbi:MAG: phosphatidylserine decarboxylase [Acidobacteriaceae bacterium]